MRALPLLIAALASTGCSGFVAGSGTRLSELKTRDEIHAKLGKPATTGSLNSESFEMYRTHRKLCDSSKGMGIAMIDTRTLGLAELYLLPREMFIAGRQMIHGQDLCVYYDKDGRVTGIAGDPDPLSMFRRKTSLLYIPEATDEVEP